MMAQVKVDLMVDSLERERVEHLIGEMAAMMVDLMADWKVAREKMWAELMAVCKV